MAHTKGVNICKHKRMPRTAAARAAWAAAERILEGNITEADRARAQALMDAPSPAKRQCELALMCKR